MTTELSNGHHNTGVPHLDVTVDIATEQGLRDGAAVIINKLRPGWSVKSIQWKLFTDGITNKLIGAWVNDIKECVLVRVYGIGTHAIIDRKQEIKNMQKVHNIGGGSELYATFENGIAYQFIPGDILTEPMAKDPKISKLVAEMMAVIHNIEIKNGEGGLWTRFEKFINLIPTSLTNKANEKRMKNEFLSREEMLTEYNMLKELLDKETIPLVFCHNDALLPNIVYQEGKVVFIDLEYGGPGPAAFDIANHFCEHTGADGVLDYDRFYPSTEFQLVWIAAYLKHYNRITKKPPPTDDEVADMFGLVDKFNLVSHLHWSAWALIQAENSNIDFDFVDYAIQRLKEYRKRKAGLGLS